MATPKPPAKAAPPPGEKLPRGGRPQFNLAGMMVVFVVLSVAAAPAYYLMRAAQGEPGAQLAGMLLVLASPLLLIVVMSGVLALARWWNRGK